MVMSDFSGIEVMASNARPTSTGASYRDVLGTDVDVRVTPPSGDVVNGSVTLLPHEDGRPGVGAWGDADNWCSGNILAALASMSDRDRRNALLEIEGEAADCAAKAAL